jgi:hypothetical protein
VAAVVNFPTKQIWQVSCPRCSCYGFPPTAPGEVVMIAPDKPVPNGAAGLY